MPVNHQRAVYRPSAGSRPLALIGSAGAMLAMAAGLVTLNVAGTHEERSRLTVVNVHDLDVTPPPPPPKAKPDTPHEALASPVAQKPMIALPSQGPTQIMVDAPPAPAPVVTPAKPTQAPAALAPAAQAAATTMEAGDLSSKVLFAKPPVYPIDARRAHEQGTVKLLVVVGSDGCVKDIQLAASSGSQRLDRAALQAVRRWRWSPTISGGAATMVRGYVTIPFVLA
ncbi:energy transducer TonB [Novosphingobium sp. Leaf2]|uniref:energy transducer TonB n=1 Tax=Novosphingobium sp. Leaf2 TaxID=1735670 RepID=UPI001F2A0487|nr:energy transducer TonB [Novosphingobium sp. Leaf2]